MPRGPVRAPRTACTGPRSFVRARAAASPHGITRRPRPRRRGRWPASGTCVPSTGPASSDAAPRSARPGFAACSVGRRGLVRWRAGGTGPADRASGPWAEVQPLLPAVGRDRRRPGRPQPRRGDSRRGLPVRAAGRPAGMTPCVLRPGGPGNTRVGEIGPQGRRSRNGQASDPPAVTRRTGPERPTSSLRRSRRGRSRDLRPPHGETFAVWGDMSLLRRCVQERCFSSCG